MIILDDNLIMIIMIILVIILLWEVFDGDQDTGFDETFE